MAGSASSLSSSSTAPQSPTTPRPGPFEVIACDVKSLIRLSKNAVCLTVYMCPNQLPLVSGLSASSCWGCAPPPLDVKARRCHVFKEKAHVDRIGRPYSCAACHCMRIPSSPWCGTVRRLYGAQMSLSDQMRGLGLGVARSGGGRAARGGAAQQAAALEREPALLVPQLPRPREAGLRQELPAHRVHRPHQDHCHAGKPPMKALSYVTSFTPLGHQREDIGYVGQV